MKIDGTGNLILHNAEDAFIWQSFDHPTDTWVSGQTLAIGQRVVASVSDLNRSSETKDPILVSASDYASYKFFYIWFDSDGHLRQYHFLDGMEKLVEDILSNELRDCGYPTVCGNYGICSDDGQCSCPKGRNRDSSYFIKVQATSYLTCSAWKSSYREKH
ncbi:hypothetical protein AQUCO_04700014v1 [Aquilegia coerulea]|uniref:Bulb-type lectin domain-containing protein n=1 Tax=Aquilegia coerulea TaxID=218851 RepID=A0A2G5CKM9_AQUCA|nr:hypothetical protein AQUCO_04700014v1 [Aquilegia coerulea]